ncbi:DnaJ-domain-containing protein [Phlegmacium glaucopus]|nr:DnaJ-domain-containing protein [Phlegmacium glaucopus]
MGTDYYKLLGIDKSATEDEVKKAYKKMAMKWHPDRNNGSEEATRKFKEVSEAFEVLSDGNKRTVYDQFGEEGLKGRGAASGPGAGFSGFPGAGGPASGGPGGTTFTFTSSGPGFGGGSRSGFAPTDPRKIFEQMFGPGNIFGNMGGFPHPGAFGGDRDDDMNGSYNIFTDGEGNTFSSSGGMPGGMPGTGSRSRPQRTTSRSGTSSKFDHGFPPSPKHDKPSEITRALKVSLEELYSGAMKHLKVGRRLLDGTTEDKVLEIQIHPGWKSGTKIRFPQSGNEQPNGKTQDLVFVVEEKPHEIFKREGNDLICNIKLSLGESLAGPPAGVTKLTKTLNLLDGRKLQVPVPLGIVKPGQETTINGEGMPIRKEGSVRNKGDLVIKWEVVFPDHLTPAQKEGIRKVLG